MHAAGLYRPASARRRPTTRTARRDGERHRVTRRGTPQRRATGRGTSRRATPVRSAARRHVVSRCVVDEASRHVTSRRRAASPHATSPRRAASRPAPRCARAVALRAEITRRPAHRHGFTTERAGQIRR
ncbi:hypothetical protein STTU_1691 [Streptomyces sp. Tu6071]|nr:hypothetical protein STTU_1691 [Streptomyces sp. Tu6071]